LGYLNMTNETNLLTRLWYKTCGVKSMNEKPRVGFFFWLWNFITWGGFLSFFLSSQHVPFKFSSGSQYVPKVPNVFLIAPHFNPICFTQSLPLLTYIGGPKGETLHPSIVSCILGSLYSFNCFFVMGPWNWFIATKKKEKSWTCEAPPTN
jgi:hypothetical protein